MVVNISVEEVRGMEPTRWTPFGAVDMIFLVFMAGS